MKSFLKKWTQKTSFRFFLQLSLGFHIFLLAGFLSSSHIRDLFKKDKKTIVFESLRVDMADLPDLEPKQEKIKKSTPIFNPDKKKPKKTKKQKKAKAFKEEQKEQNKKTIAEKNKSASPASKVNKGHRVSKGSQEGKETLDPQQKAEINIYFTLIKGQIKSHWDLPKYLADKNLMTQIEIKINHRGIMTERQIVASSGNDLFDSHVLKAVESASPYPSPPPSAQALIKDGLVLTWSSRD